VAAGAVRPDESGTWRRGGGQASPDPRPSPPCSQVRSGLSSLALDSLALCLANTRFQPYGPDVVSAYRPGQAAALLGVSVDTVRRWADSGRLRTRRTNGGQRLIDGASLAGLLVDQAPEQDDEVIVARSARNRFPGIITSVLADEIVAKVEMQAGPHRIVSLMTAQAAKELGLEPGVLAVAAVKSTNVVIEVSALPDRP
jgi:molybdopterin-binding protein